MTIEMSAEMRAWLVRFANAWSRRAMPDSLGPSAPADVADVMDVVTRVGPPPSSLPESVTKLLGALHPLMEYLADPVRFAGPEVQSVLTRRGMS